MSPLFPLLSLMIPALLSDVSYEHQAPMSLLRDLILGEVIPCCGPRYDQLRSVNNRACVSRPEVIVRPATTEDVAIAVNFARRNGLKFSVRSGGHSYTCTNIRDGGLHIDLRRLRKVELIQTSESGTGYAALLGPGNTWGNVLRVLPIQRWSYPHGQCPGVGVGGYLLGGGVNWLGTFNKYGYGAEHILRMRVVTANGTIVDLSPGHATLHPKYQHEPVTQLSVHSNNDLFFAMRGAGASFAIATEILYTIYPEPETQPAIFLVWINSMKDLWKIQKAAFTSKQYSITINNEFAGDFWNNFKTRIVYKFLPTLLSSIKLLHREGATPVFITVTDISPGAPLYTAPVPALRYLIRRNVDLVYTSPVLVTIIDTLARYLYDMNIAESEVQPPGEYNLAGVNLGGMVDTNALQRVFFNNPFFGVLRPNNQMFREIGCDYCFWTIHFRNRQQFLSGGYTGAEIATNTDNNLKHGVDSNLVCLFKDRWSQCPREIIRIKKSMESYLDKVDKPYSKYINWPSCDSTDWMWRYWGQNYNRLLDIKAYWDPGNIFSHCQSVGSSDNECCPFTLSRPQGPPPP